MFQVNEIVLGISNLTWESQVLPVIGMIVTFVLFYFVLPTAALIWAVYVIRRTNRWLDKREQGRAPLHDLSRERRAP